MPELSTMNDSGRIASTPWKRYLVIVRVVRPIYNVWVFLHRNIILAPSPQAAIRHGRLIFKEQIHRSFSYDIEDFGFDDSQISQYDEGFYIQLWDKNNDENFKTSFVRPGGPVILEVFAIDDGNGGSNEDEGAASLPPFELGVAEVPKRLIYFLPKEDPAKSSHCSYTRERFKWYIPFVEDDGDEDEDMDESSDSGDSCDSEEEDEDLSEEEGDVERDCAMEDSGDSGDSCDSEEEIADASEEEGDHEGEHDMEEEGDQLDNNKEVVEKGVHKEEEGMLSMEGGSANSATKVEESTDHEENVASTSETITAPTHNPENGVTNQETSEAEDLEIEEEELSLLLADAQVPLSDLAPEEYYKYLLEEFDRELLQQLASATSWFPDRIWPSMNPYTISSRGTVQPVYHPAITPYMIIVRAVLPTYEPYVTLEQKVILAQTTEAAIHYGRTLFTNAVINCFTYPERIPELNPLNLKTVTDDSLEKIWEASTFDGVRYARPHGVVILEVWKINNDVESLRPLPGGLWAQKKTLVYRMPRQRFWRGSRGEIGVEEDGDVEEQLVSFDEEFERIWKSSEVEAMEVADG
ncbi:hypothetical protein HDV00_005011 [Rhizophlyctis rosea]|nr:hypothetical protein HDV00_005011 [Rhizophlyctis rosea]